MLFCETQAFLLPLTRNQEREKAQVITFLCCDAVLLLKISLSDPTQGGTKLFAVSDRKLSMIPDSRVLESNKSKKLAAIEILRTF